MKPKNFIAIFNARAKNTDMSTNTLIGIAENILKPKKYIPYDKKIDLADITLQQINGTKHPTAERYRQFIINIISIYTELEMDSDAFDVFCENGLIDLILSTFENEYETCTSVLNMCLSDDKWG